MQKVFDTLKPEYNSEVAFINIDVNNPAEAAVLASFKVEYIPATFLLDGKGRVVLNYVGPLTEEAMRTKLNSLVGGE